MVYTDSSGFVTYQMIEELPDSAFHKGGNSVVGASFTSSAYWVKLSDLNQYDVEKVLSVDNVLIDTLEVYYRQGGKICSRHSGLMVPFSEKELNATFHAVKIPNAVDDDVVYVRFKSKGISIVSLNLQTPSEFVNSQTSRFIFYGVLSGFILILCMGSFILAIVKGRTTLFLLSAHLLVTCLVNWHFQGITPYFIFPENPNINVWLPIVLVVLYLITSQYLAYYLLQVPVYVHRLTWLKYVPFGGFLVLVVCVFILDRQLANQICNALGALNLIGLVVVGIICIRNKAPLAIYFTIGWVAYLLFLLPFTLKNSGAIQPNVFSENSPAIGSAVEVAVLGIIALVNLKRKEEELLVQKDTLDKQASTIVDLNKSVKNLETILNQIETTPETVNLNHSILMKLSAREMEVVAELIAGLKYKEIANKLFVSENTIKTHIKSIYSKLNVSNKVELINELKQ